ncbi:MAG: ABC transporter permease, partial [Thermoanaerobaculia bacterium]
MSWLRRLRNRWRQEELAREFDAELQFHLDHRTEANIRRGIAPDEAAFEARRHFGNVTRAREEMRAARVATWLDGIGNDLRYAVRVFARHPAITALTILMLSLGIGANTAVFSVFEAVLLRPLPYPDAERLVLLLESDGGGRGLTTPTVPEVLDLRKFTRSFDAVTFFDTRDFQTTGGDEPQRVIGARVEASFLATLGARASLGRIFGAADGAVPDRSIVLLGYGFWQRSFGSDPRAIGRTLSINGEPYEIVGVLSETFSVGQYLAPAIDVYFPYPSSP